MIQLENVKQTIMCPSEIPIHYHTEHRDEFSSSHCHFDGISPYSAGPRYFAFSLYSVVKDIDAILMVIPVFRGRPSQ
jgi:hypothetical protein